MPASNARAIEKAKGLACDVVILDLEDAVAPEAKAEARAQAVAAVCAGGFGEREVVIRCNALSTPWGADDLQAAAKAGPDAVVVPKIQGPADIAANDAALKNAPAKTELWAMIETCPAVFALEPIAAMARTSRLRAFCLGFNDLAKEMGCRQTPGREPFWAVLTLAVAAGRIHGLTLLDSVFNGVDDLEGLEAASRQGADFGFDGKTIIHPSHIEACNRVFGPDSGEVQWARAVIAAFAAPENAGRGALRVEGRLAERLHLAQAEALAARAEAIAAREAAD